MGHNCTLCSSGFDKQKIRAPYVYGGSEKHNFWECSECSLVYLLPTLSNAEEKLFYAKEFERFMENRTGGDRSWSGPEAHIQSNQDHVIRRWEFLKDYIKSTDEVLEIGCSSGFMLDDIRNKGIKVAGIEPSGGFGDYLSKKGHEHYNSLAELKENRPDAKYDVIIHFFVLEHVRNAVDFLSSQLELLKPDGLIIAEVPNVDDPLTSIYNIPAFEKFYWSIAHHYYYSPKSLSPELDKLDCSEYFFKLDQRYDLSNHITWLQEGKPGGQGKFNNIFSKKTLDAYKRDLINCKHCDTFFLYIKK
jgi:SAM-dependent methyltransferase